ncbi:PEP-CTERM sorting domain-containing protein [Aliiglaciecola sp. LCG003]|uniref:PEP-CTERM sorting domain-containing protein n=1 Tax=Aliiglaciecola sp. LCG003 TaxID=3053655 RepID=UPI00257428B7|nr:PEP-CTERM sorting domain-containing protein [Aliiglaciecola sp. LCG003]WJG11225.1 PEP-CTERM sorting domain-containing protein [Aliiglaciecola sp. LCG003]
MKLLKPLFMAALVTSTSFAYAAPITLPASGNFNTADVNYSDLVSDCGGGYTCFTDASSLGAGGGSDHFDDAMGIALNGIAYGVSGGDWDGSSLTLDTVTVGAININVEFMSLGPVMRQIVTLTNTGGVTESANVSWQNNTGNDGNQRTVATSSGDLLATTDDNWVVTADNDSGADNEVNSWVYGSGQVDVLSPTTVLLTDNSPTFGGAGEEGFTALFDMDLLAGQTSALMFFVGIEGINQDGIDLAGILGDTFSALFSSLTADLSAAEFDQIRNWNVATSVPEPTTLAILAVGLLGLRARQKRS